MKIAFLDAETTGLNPEKDRIIELGVVFTEDFIVTDNWSILINPGRSIPVVTKNLTGIDSELLLNAPSFEEIAEQVLCLLDEYVICGHNISFDYAFLKMEFQRCGFHFSKKLLDTVHLSKTIYPGKNSYSLKSLCSALSIINDNPHRALSDATATTDLFLKLRLYAGAKLFDKIIHREISRLSPNLISGIQIDDLPEKSGIYYFLNHRSKPVYIGRAKNIKSRVQSHLRGEGISFKILAASERIKEIKFTTTGSELLAMLLEDHEIRHHWPALNNSQKSFNKRFGITVYKDQLNRWRMAICSSGKAYCFIASFHHYHKAVDFVLHKIKTYSLNGNYCNQPVISQINDSFHNLAFESMLEEINQSVEIEVFFTEGRSEDERGFVWIENGIYKGFGYADKKLNYSPEQLRTLLQLRYSSVTVEKIIENLKRNGHPDLVFKEIKKAPVIDYNTGALFQI